MLLLTLSHLFCFLFLVFGLDARYFTRIYHLLAIWLLICIIFGTQVIKFTIQKHKFSQTIIIFSQIFNFYPNLMLLFSQLVSQKPLSPHHFLGPCQRYLTHDMQRTLIEFRNATFILLHQMYFRSIRV